MFDSVVFEIASGQYGTFYNVVLAGSMFNTLPMVLLFVFFSRFYVQGVSYSGIK